MKKEVDFQGQCSSQNNIQSHPEQLFLQQHMQQNSDNHMNIFGGQPQPWSINHEPLFLVPPTSYTSLFNTRVPSSSHHQHLWINISDNTYGVVNMSAQEIIEAKALAASKSHSEAERRRRERINNHLAKLRTMLPNTTKIDKASLLAEVINHVRLFD
ncbi:transcription factor bHLH30 [Trifolium repens]|nr:transcription factor bHLH30 [Trifolium repens]